MFSKEYHMLNKVYTTSKEDGYSNNAATTNDNKKIAKISYTITNFTNTPIIHRDTFNYQSKMKAQLQQQLHELQEQNTFMQEMMYMALNNDHANIPGNNNNPSTSILTPTAPIVPSFNSNASFQIYNISQYQMTLP